ncbi:FAD-dependent monooxygenase, partial [Rubrivirga sp.]|uniref:FAD-dependent monooxygenase n=1 Tax=Rubrivirga sp. TaxID=1885344 RepID=UPI003C74B22D
DQLIGAVEPVSQRYVAWRALAAWPEWMESDAVEMWGDGVRFGIFRLDRGRAYWYALATAMPGVSSSRPSCDEIESLFRGWTPRVLEVVASTDGPIAQHDVFDRPPAKRLTSGRVVLVGDAAHGMTPDLGQGGAQGLEDAAALARHLDLEDDVVRALAGYERERRRRAAWIQRQSRFAGRLGQLSGLAGRVRNQVARVTPSGAFQAGFTAAF